MNKFEADLFTTVDSILHLLGHSPSVKRNPKAEVCDTVTINRSEIPNSHVKSVSVSRKGARLVKSPSDLAKLLDKM